MLSLNRVGLQVRRSRPDQHHPSILISGGVGTFQANKLLELPFIVRDFLFEGRFFDTFVMAKFHELGGRQLLDLEEVSVVGRFYLLVLNLELAIFGSVHLGGAAEETRVSECLMVSRAGRSHHLSKLIIRIPIIGRRIFTSNVVLTGHDHSVVTA